MRLNARPKEAGRLQLELSIVGALRAQYGEEVVGTGVEAAGIDVAEPEPVTVLPDASMTYQALPTPWPVVSPGFVSLLK